MSQSFIPSGLDMALSGGRLSESIRRRGLTRDYLPAIRKYGFAARYPTGGQGEAARARRELWKAPRALEVGVAA